MQVHDIHTHTPTEVKKKPEKSPEIGSEWVGEKNSPESKTRTQLNGKWKNNNEPCGRAGAECRAQSCECVQVNEVDACFRQI